MLRGGVVTSYVVKDLADQMGTNMAQADQVMDGAMEDQGAHLRLVGRDALVD
jgi:hypothetical protein